MNPLAFGNDILIRHLEDCRSHTDLAGVSAALPDRGRSESEPGGFPGANRLRALDFAWAP